MRLFVRGLMSRAIGHGVATGRVTPSDNIRLADLLWYYFVNEQERRQVTILEEPHGITFSDDGYPL